MSGTQLKWLALASGAAQHSLEHLLTSGAAILYSKYLAGKLPLHLHPQLDALLAQTLSPLVSLPPSSEGRPTAEAVPSDTFRRLKPKWQKRTLSPTQTDSKFRPSTAALSRTVDFTRRTSTAPCHHRTRTRNSQKDPFISLALDAHLPPETEKVWTARKHRYEQSQKQERETLQRARQDEEERDRLRRQLETLQSAQMPIPYDHETGRLHEPPQPPQPHPAEPPSQPLLLGFEVGPGGGRGRQPEQRRISNTRKIISFCRQKRGRDHSEAARAFGNNGRRQESSIPFLDLSQGIRISEEDAHSLHRQAPHPKRQAESSFRSYARERMASLEPAEEQPPHSKQTQRTTSQSVGGSLLWTQREGQGGHRVSGNRLLAAQCLEVALD